ncbi:metal-sensitive transcriptional regulator [Microlunatus soli]|uniref:DNA-binding transcriptional regulator, FrmR family n=1 Tax=Microlunatus soli TaxID=630515 RepID=A0A1H1UP43_9ACTN|nr:DNA-binding transcriptional regulator, FrmR family [Microlunatus soli]
MTPPTDSTEIRDDIAELPASATTGASGEAGAEEATAHQHGYLTHNHKAEYLKRLRRIEGQARGLQRMIEEEKYCIDVLTQVSAMTSALQSVALGLLDDHLDHCVAEAVRSGGDDADAKLKEASQAIARLVRS